MNHDKACDKLTDEVMAELCLDDTRSYRIIKMRIEMAYAVGFSEKYLAGCKGRKILQCTLDGILIRPWETIREASRALNINGPNITNCARGVKKTAGGFKWEYTENYEVNPFDP